MWWPKGPPLSTAHTHLNEYNILSAEYSAVLVAMSRTKLSSLEAAGVAPAMGLVAWMLCHGRDMNYGVMELPVQLECDLLWWGPPEDTRICEGYSR